MGVQKLTGEGGRARLGRWGVGCISDECVTGGCQVRPNLVRAPGYGPRLYEKKVATYSQHSYLRAGRLTVRANYATPPVGGVALQWPIQQKRFSSL